MQPIWAVVNRDAIQTALESDLSTLSRIHDALTSIGGYSIAHAGSGSADARLRSTLTYIRSLLRARHQAGFDGGHFDINWSSRKIGRKTLDGGVEFLTHTRGAMQQLVDRVSPLRANGMQPELARYWSLAYHVYRHTFTNSWYHVGEAWIHQDRPQEELARRITSHGRKMTFLILHRGVGRFIERVDDLHGSPAETYISPGLVDVRLIKESAEGIRQCLRQVHDELTSEDRDLARACDRLRTCSHFVQAADAWSVRGPQRLNGISSDTLGKWDIWLSDAQLRFRAALQASRFELAFAEPELRQLWTMSLLRVEATYSLAWDMLCTAWHSRNVRMAPLTQRFVDQEMVAVQTSLIIALEHLMSNDLALGKGRRSSTDDAHVAS